MNALTQFPQISLGDILSQAEMKTPAPMKIAIATDAWFPQVNGVVRTLSATIAELDRRGIEVELITPERFFTLPMPGYSQIRLAMAPRFSTRRMLDAFSPDIVHIATEGPIGWSARGWCPSPRPSTPASPNTPRCARASAPSASGRSCAAFMAPAAR